MMAFRLLCASPIRWATCFPWAARRAQRSSPSSFMSDQDNSQPSGVQSLSKRRYEALAGYARDPKIVLIIDELEWYATADERIIGMLTFDKIDHDFGWVIFGKDERHRFRAINVNVSFPTRDASRT